MTLSQIRRRIELCLREIIFRFEMNLKIYFFLDSSIHIRNLKQVPLSNWTVETLGDYSPQAETSTQGLECKTNTLRILMHQMRILTIQVSSEMNWDLPLLLGIPLIIETTSQKMTFLKIIFLFERGSH
jgi:hypothetical protein